MLTKIEHFTNGWKMESDGTRKVFGALTDQSLSQKVADDHRTLGRIAWHVVLTLGEMGSGVGLDINCPPQDTPVPKSAKEIQDAYDKAAASLGESVAKDWTDDKLPQEVELYGMKFTYGFTLGMLINHEVHHRGQMTVLMRQAGLKVPGIYGPSLEEWDAFGGKPPEV